MFSNCLQVNNKLRKEKIFRRQKEPERTNSKYYYDNDDDASTAQNSSLPHMVDTENYRMNILSNLERNSSNNHCSEQTSAKMSTNASTTTQSDSAANDNDLDNNNNNSNDILQEKQKGIQQYQNEKQNLSGFELRQSEYWQQQFNRLEDNIEGSSDENSEGIIAGPQPESNNENDDSTIDIIPTSSSYNKDTGNISFDKS